MKNFGTAMQEALQARGEADIELAHALAQMGTSAVSKAAELARGAVDLLLANGKLQTDAIMANAEAGAIAMNKAAAAGVLGRTALGAGGTAMLGATAYRTRQLKRRTSEAVQDASDQLQRQFMPQRAAGQPCLPCLDESSGQARRQ